MNERQSSEIEKVLLYINDARTRTRKAVEAVEKDNADAYVIAALADAERELAELHRKLAQRTYYAVPADSLTFAL